MRDEDVRTAALALVTHTLAGELIERAQLLGELCLEPHGSCLAAQELADAIAVLCVVHGGEHDARLLWRSYAVTAQRHIFGRPP